MAKNDPKPPPTGTEKEAQGQHEETPFERMQRLTKGLLAVPTEAIREPQDEKKTSG